VGARRALVISLAAVLIGCGGDEREAAPEPNSPDTINFSTPDFNDGAAIPAELTCDGAGRAPTIVWRAIPPETTELVMIVDDPDAPDGTFTHWTVYGLTGATGAGLAPEGKFPAGVLSGKNSAGKEGWTPPCPPEGEHRYVFTLYALGDASGLQAGAEPDAVREAVKDALAHGRFTGTYKRG
jgi:Raf kinase inhibitor-like YbhB/YbcL family protein